MFLGAKCRSAVRMQSAQLSMQRAVLAHCTVCTIDYIKGCEVSRPSRHSLIHNGGFTCGHREVRSPCQVKQTLSSGRVRLGCIRQY